MPPIKIKFNNKTDLSWAYGNFKKYNIVDNIDVDNLILIVKEINDEMEIKNLLNALSIFQFTII